MNLYLLKFRLIIYGLAPLLCLGCASLVDKAGRALDGSAFAEKKAAVYRTAEGSGETMEIQKMRNKAGEYSIVIIMDKFPAMKIRGSAPDEQGEFQFIARDYLGGNVHGWNEYRLELSGPGNLVLSETTAMLSVPDEIETVGISSGRIRRYDTRITGTDALSGLRNRHERILAITEWLNSRENLSALNSQKEFEEYWKPVLFPEMVLNKKRPEGWQMESDQWVRAEDIRWNTSYTRRVFPELLWDIRNSGTMLRDWEEAVEWIYIEYEWSRIQELLSRETLFDRKK
ncbi:MAG: hypothetical protein LBH20_06190 [Treponema sp.]|jgi:hypothetical protein|nr:hypothetical protein [Treponema sp.]